MARRRGTSRVTEPGGGPQTGSGEGPPEFPSIRQRQPVVFWTVILATAALVVPLVAGLIQVLL